MLHIWEPVYRINIYYIKTKSQKECLQIIKKEFGIELKKEKSQAGHFGVMRASDGEEVGVIWATDNINLAHECMHAVFWIAERRGLELHEKSEEAYCYLHTFLMRTILT